MRWTNLRQRSLMMKTKMATTSKLKATIKGLRSITCKESGGVCVSARSSIYPKSSCTRVAFVVWSTAPTLSVCSLLYICIRCNHNLVLSSGTLLATWLFPICLHATAHSHAMLLIIITIVAYLSRLLLLSQAILFLYYAQCHCHISCSVYVWCLRFVSCCLSYVCCLSLWFVSCMCWHLWILSFLAHHVNQFVFRRLMSYPNAP